MYSSRQMLIRASAVRPTSRKPHAAPAAIRSRTAYVRIERRLPYRCSAARTRIPSVRGVRPLTGLALRLSRSRRGIERHGRDNLSCAGPMYPDDRTGGRECQQIQKHRMLFEQFTVTR